MAHPSRKDFFPYLKEKLGDVPITVDEGWGITENCKRAWQMHDPKADFHIVIQDDCIVCDNFKERAEKILIEYEEKRKVKNYKTRAYNFYYAHRVRLKEEAALGEKRGWVIHNVVRWGPAVCLPTKLIPEMLNYFETLKDPQDDERISKYLKKKGILVVFPIPSLINHRHGNSLVGNDSQGPRQAYKFIDA